MSVSLFAVANPSQFHQDWVGWVPCDLHKEKKATVKAIFLFPNEASLEMLSAAMEECKCSVGIRSDNVRLLEMERERDSREKEVQLIICCCFLLRGFLSSHRYRNI